jgi:hypothetical protein
LIVSLASDQQCTGKARRAKVRLIAKSRKTINKKKAAGPRKGEDKRM